MLCCYLSSISLLLIRPKELAPVRASLSMRPTEVDISGRRLEVGASISVHILCSSFTLWIEKEKGDREEEEMQRGEGCCDGHFRVGEAEADTSSCVTGSIWHAISGIRLVFTNDEWMPHFYLWVWQVDWFTFGAAVQPNVLIVTFVFTWAKSSGLASVCRQLSWWLGY